MKKWFIALSLCLGIQVHAATAEWLSDLPTALKKAQAEDKAVLVDFTGSDWCGWCIKLKKEVFDQPQFIEFANQNLVLVEVDFPRKKKLSPSQEAANEALAKKYNIEGFPTVYVLDKDGKTILQTGYVPGGANAFIADLKKRGLKGKPAGAKPQASVYPPPSPAPINYDSLALKGITGGKKKLALINNRTLEAGESASVKVGDKQVKVVCKEIRDNSVLVEVDGEARELKLGSDKALKPAVVK